MGAVTSRPRPTKQRQDPVLKAFGFCGQTFVTTQVLPSSTSKLPAKSVCVVRFGAATATVTRENAVEAMAFATYLAQQAKIVLDCREPGKAVSHGL